MTFAATSHHVQTLPFRFPFEVSSDPSCGRCEVEQRRRCERRKQDAVASRTEFPDVVFKVSGDRQTYTSAIKGQELDIAIHLLKLDLGIMVCG